MNRCVALLLGLALATLTACSSRSGSYTQIARDLLTEDRTSYPRTLAEVQAYPYAQLGVRLGDKRRGIAVLAEYEGENHRWVAADGVSFLTSPDGWLLDVRSGSVETRSRVPRGVTPAGMAGQRYLRTVETPEGIIRLRCEMSKPGDTEIVLLGEIIKAIRLAERCEVDGLTTEREIFLSGDGKMLRLAGAWYPGGPNIQLDVLKVPA